MMIELEFHEAANIFPMMGDADLKVLSEDIAANGLHEPIWIDDQSRIVDGRNRYRACVMAGIEPKLRPYRPAEHGELIAFVVSCNLHRRHLSESQRAAVGAKIATLNRHDFSGNRWGHNPRVDQSTDSTLSEAEAAKMLNVGEATIRRAKRVAREDPKAFAEIERGETKVNTAIGKLRQRGLRQANMGKEPKIKLVHDSRDQIAEQICALCNNLAGVAGKISPEEAWKKIAENTRYRNNADRSVSAAAHFLGDLHRLWAAEQKKTPPAETATFS